MPADWSFAHPDPAIGEIAFADLAAAREDDGIGRLSSGEGPVGLRRVEHEYPGADGLSVMLLGRRQQNFPINVLLCAEDDEAIELLMARLRQAQDGQTGALTMRDEGIESRLHCELFSVTATERRGDASGRRYLWASLVFRKLAPDAPGWWSGLQGA